MMMSLQFKVAQSFMRTMNKGLIGEWWSNYLYEKLLKRCTKTYWVLILKQMDKI